MPTVTSGEIRIETVIPIADILGLFMNVQKNTHTVISLKGFIPQEVGEDALFIPMEKADLKVWTGDKLLFRGLIKETQIVHEGGGYQIFIQGISNTIQIDYEKKNCTFQNINSTYKEVIREVLENTAGANFYFCASDRRIAKPLYQIEETDWEFIKRLASHLETSVTPFALTERPDIYVGDPQGRVHTKDNLNALSEKIWIDKERESFCQWIRTYEDIFVGDRIKWDGILYTVREKNCQLEKGILYFRYRIDTKNAFADKPYQNQKAIGRFLSARVLDTREEQIKVKFDIDKSQTVEYAYWYPWRPDMGNLMYCMPEKGERVYIHLGGHFGEQAYAVCSVHENGEENPEMKNTDRYFTTSDKKRMYLLPDIMGFRDLKQKNPLEVSLADNSGISTVSNKRMVISARDTIGIKGNNVFFQAPKEVSLVRRDSVLPAVINMCNGFDSIGATNRVSMTGTGDAQFPIFHEYEQETGEEYSLEGIEKSVIASTPGVSLKSGLEKQIRGIMVDNYEREY